VQLFENGELISDRACRVSPLNPLIAVACVTPTTWRGCRSYVQARSYVTVIGHFGQDFNDSQWDWSPTLKMCPPPD
jgi:hypothetical protein